MLVYMYHSIPESCDVTHPFSFFRPFFCPTSGTKCFSMLECCQPRIFRCKITPPTTFAKPQINQCTDADALSLRRHFQLLPPPLLPLLRKHLPTNRQHPLKPLPPFHRILPEPLHRKLLDCVLNLRPPTTERNNPRLLLKRCPARYLTRRIHHRLLDRQQITPRHILRAHGDFLGRGINVGDFVHEACVLATEESADPLRRGLLAGDEALGAEDVCCWVEGAGESVNTYYV